jgi:hypothetical protein
VVQDQHQVLGHLYLQQEDLQVLLLMDRLVWEVLDQAVI